ASCAVNPAEVHKDEEKPQAQSVSSETAVPQSDGLPDLLRSLDDAGIYSIDNYNGASIFDRQKFAVMLKNAPDMAVNRTHLDSALWATKFHLANTSRQMAAGGNYIYAAIGKSEGLVEISAVINKIPLNSFVADYPELYWKIRNLFAPSRGVDRGAYEKYRSAADPYMLSAFSAMKENNPGFTDWEISEFYVFLEREDIGVTEYCASYAISGDVDSFPASGTINADMKLQGAAGMSYYIIVADGDVLRVISSAVKLSDFSSRQELLDYLSGRK
ncbi:MAG: hypothetical protein II794_07820, partial [Oscillospiraceae bacterium]|nr:hypothetical protein [Oscillospiraceae bacterium]